MKLGKFPSWVRDLTGSYKRSIVVALALGLVASGFSALLMFTSGYLISDTALIGTTLFAIMIPVAFVQLFGLGRPLARYLERLVSHSWVLRITSDLRLALYRDFLSRSDDPAKSRSAGEYLGLLSDDVAHLQNLYLRVAFPTAVALLVYVGACIAFGVFSVPFALLMVIVFALEVIALPACALMATRATSALLKQDKSDERAKLADDVLGSLDWVLSGRASEASKSHLDALEGIRAQDARVRTVQRAIALSQALTLGLVLCLVIAWASSIFGTPGADPNWIAAFALGFFPLIESFSLLPAAAASYNGHVDAIARLDDHLEWTDSQASTAESQASNAAAKQLRLELSHVSYRYANTSTDALKDVSLTVPSRQKLAILGKSGSGKSTLAGIIRSKLKPVEGSVALYDGDDEVALPQTCVGFISKSEHIFNRSVRANLNMGNEEASDEVLWDALRKVGLFDIVSSYENGLDTVLGETGVGLSGGQSHRLALARILVADYPIVVIDEPFAALDPQTEEVLLDMLLETLRDKTLIVITHHLARIESFDRVVFFSDGEVTLDGTPADLMKESDYFRTLVAMDRA